MACWSSLVKGVSYNSIIVHLYTLYSFIILICIFLFYVINIRILEWLFYLTYVDYGFIRAQDLMVYITKVIYKSWINHDTCLLWRVFQICWIFELKHSGELCLYFRILGPSAFGVDRYCHSVNKNIINNIVAILAWYVTDQRLFSGLAIKYIPLFSTTAANKAIHTSSTHSIIAVQALF